MEATIVVLIDYDNSCVRLFGDYNRVILFEDAFLLPIFIEGKDVIYISQCDIISGDEVIETVNEMPLDHVPEKRYIQSKIEGYLKAADARITFGGRRDVKPLEKYGYDIFARSKDLRELLKADKIDVIPETKALSAKKQIPTKVSKDSALDSILLKTSVKDFEAQDDDMFDDEKNEVSGDESAEVVSEAEVNIRKGYGRKE